MRTAKRIALTLLCAAGWLVFDPARRPMPWPRD